MTCLAWIRLSLSASGSGAFRSKTASISVRAEPTPESTMRFAE